MATEATPLHSTVFAVPFGCSAHQAYATSNHAPVVDAFATLPTERCPLNAVTTGRIEGTTYDIEKVHFDSRPGLPVTANLYLPRACRSGAVVPGIVHSCGHSFTGKAEEKYQEASARLASSGMAVLIFDPINQGERDQYHCAESNPNGLPTSHHLRSACTCAHNMMGKQLELLGDNFGAWRAWDGMVALDYLLTRPEVDPAHLGITGNSGGGTMTSWIWALVSCQIDTSR
jgi:cephalosporin-C deacetylase-like acetyl esterase